MAEERRYRLVTRSDLDGLACALLLKTRGMIDDILFVHPKDVQDGKVPIGPRDITTNLPFVPQCHLAFDHHASEVVRAGGRTPANLVLDPGAPSAARVVYTHLGGKAAFPSVSQEMLAAVDKGDSARYTKEEILDPRGWVLLNFIVDPRTGFGRFKTFRVSNYQLMLDLIDYCGQHSRVEDILRLPDVAERVQMYREHRVRSQAQLLRCARVHANLVVLDVRNEDPIYVANRFLIYALYPQCNISMYVMWGLNRQNTVFAMGKSILSRTSKTNIGTLALSYGGGGHDAAGTCQVDNDRAATVLDELIRRINTDG
jgi:nanoRNase/pAp phosphatase (c-di-AMP/oligoRNAs hydrolase)